MLQLQLIQIYCLVCECYTTKSCLHYQRQSNNYSPRFTDAEAITIYLFCTLQAEFTNRSSYNYIVNHWLDWFPDLPSYQAYNFRINELYWHFEVIINYLVSQMDYSDCYANVCLIDSLPIMLAKYPDRAKVAPMLASKGYCDAKSQYYHGVKLHCLGKDRFEQIPKPSIIRITAANVHDLTAVKPIICQLNNQYVIGDRAYASESLNQLIKKNNSAVLTPVKRKKGQRTKSAEDNLISKYISAVRQPIESFFRWLINKTDIQNAAKVRSEKALWTHCFGRIASALILFIINP